MICLRAAAIEPLDHSTPSAFSRNTTPSDYVGLLGFSSCSICVPSFGRPPFRQTPQAFECDLLTSPFDTISRA